MERPIDTIIREAAERGAFDNLPGKGKPQRFDEEGTTPDDLRMGYTVLKNSGFVPEEVEWLKEIDALKERLATTTDPTERSAILKTIEDRQVRVRIFLESMRR
jgi:hypothetical protein